MELRKKFKKVFVIIMALAMSASFSIMALAASPQIFYDDYCLTKTEWNSGRWGDPNQVVYLTVDENYDYNFSIVKRSGKWTNGGYMRFVRISDNKVIWQAKQNYASDWYTNLVPGKLLSGLEGDYRIAYGYGEPYVNSNWMQYYSKIIRVTKANK